MSLLLLLLLPLSLLANEAGAAKITFEPNELTASVAPGEVVTVPVAVSLTETTSASSSTIFSLSRVEGTLDPDWINNQINVFLNYQYPTKQVPLKIKVPADAKGGVYTHVFRTVLLRPNDQITPADLMINVEVGETFTCNQAPVFKDISSAEETINVRNHKEVAIDLSGAVSSPDECDIVKVWFELTDEYNELDQDEVPLDITLDIDGNWTFSVAVPMVASRKGGDEDGRLYTVKFFAENDAGVVEGPETRVVVLHDNGKKRGHDSKK